MSGSVFDNLVFASSELISDGVRAPIPLEFEPVGLSDLYAALKARLSTRVSPVDLQVGLLRMLRYLTMSSERRATSLETSTNNSRARS